mmetsp:Transcript_14484/g.44128  ORF Transcript_14484/g.44128 Transcript_14484/m.44128 type:complete len:213 (+) Transcript_14484:8168-8806(+)
MPCTPRTRAAYSACRRLAGRRPHLVRHGALWRRRAPRACLHLRGPGPSVRGGVRRARLWHARWRGGGDGLGAQLCPPGSRATRVPLWSPARRTRRLCGRVARAVRHAARGGAGRHGGARVHRRLPLWNLRCLLRLLRPLARAARGERAPGLSRRGGRGRRPDARDAGWVQLRAHCHARHLRAAEPAAVPPRLGPGGGGGVRLRLRHRVHCAG